MNNQATPHSTADRAYRNVALLVFSVAFLLTGTILYSNHQNTTYTLTDYIALGLGSISIIILIFLIGDTIAYYGFKTYEWFREKWPRYNLYYWMFFLGLALLVLLVIGYFKLQRENFWTLTLNTAGALLVGILVLVIWHFIRNRKNSAELKK